VETIMAAIERLSEPDRRKLTDWLDEHDERAWDAEMQRDFAPGGRGHALAEKVGQEIQGDKFTSLDIHCHR
jgi:hypothetical protein